MFNEELNNFKFFKLTLFTIYYVVHMLTKNDTISLEHVLKYEIM